MMFGHQQVKREGSTIAFDSERPSEDEKPRTYWFERAFTKDQFRILSIELAGSAIPWVAELSKDFAERAENGYGG